MQPIERDETMDKWLRRAVRPLRMDVLRRRSGQTRAGPKNAIFDLAMPSQIRWAVSQTGQNFVIPCPSPPSCASMVGLFALPQRVQLLVTCGH
jgi:hypothetical protein